MDPTKETASAEEAAAGAAPEPVGAPPATKRGRGGRPPKFDPAIGRRLVASLRKGNYIEAAAASIGVSKQTVYEWLRAGARAKSGALHDFAAAAEKAQGEAEVADLGRMGRLAGKGNFKAIAWRLEHRNPRRYGRQVQLIVTKAIDDYLAFLKANLPADVFDHVIAVTMTWDPDATAAAPREP
jgi:hypothetical protein